MAIELQSLYACEHCYLVVAGYDAHELGLTLADLAPTYDGLNELEGTVVTGDPEESRTFDSAPCDVCGTGLAGSRHEVVAMTGERDSAPTHECDPSHAWPCSAVAAARG